jgi:hypothetical protein
VATVGLAAAMAGISAAATSAPSTSGTSAVAAGATGGHVEKIITYTCNFPLVGTKPVTADVKVTFPATGKVGQIIQGTGFSAVATLDASTTSALRLIGAATVDGTANPQIDANISGVVVTLALPFTIPSTKVPATGNMGLPFVGAIPGFAVHKAGTVTLSIGANFTGTATPKTAAGKPTQLGTINLACTQNPGQNATLASIPVS